MAIGGHVSDIIFELKQNNFYKKISSVIDMGDQDVNLTYDEIVNSFNKFGIEFNKELFVLAKDYPTRPRVSSSVLWKTLGVKTADKIDMVELKRPENQIVGKVYKHDLNFPLTDKNLLGKYDLVTDFGNNEHPFNFIEAFITMHKLCKEKGYLMIHQGLFKGNGYVNFDVSFFENFAAVNNYSIVHSCLVFTFPNKIYFSTPVKRAFFDTVDINKVSEISIFYLLKKELSSDFKFPYQDYGSAWQSNEMYKIKYSYQDEMPNKFYIPFEKKVSKKNLLKKFIKKILNFNG